MNATRPQTPMRRRLVTRFSRADSGATAVEFALIALPFITLLLAIFQTTLVFFAGQTFQTAVSDASRMIMTGQAKAGHMDVAAFKQEVCSRLSGLFACKVLYIDTKTYPSYAAAQMTPPPLKDGKIDPAQFQYEQSNGGQIVVVRAVYPFPLYMDIFGLTGGHMADGSFPMMATAVFRNEPFGS